MEGKAGRFDKGDFIPPPKALSLEDRIAGRMEAPQIPGELKPYASSRVQLYKNSRRSSESSLRML
jgi:hypothetical protein